MDVRELKAFPADRCDDTDDVEILAPGEDAYRGIFDSWAVGEIRKGDGVVRLVAEIEVD